MRAEVAACWRLVTSLRTTLWILGTLCVLLLLNVVVPQREVLGAEAFAAATSGGAARFLLVTAGLGHVSTSLPFAVTLGAFFVNLGAVLIDRARATVRRLRSRRPDEAQLRTWATSPSSLVIDRPAGWDGGRAIEALRRLGYRVERPGASSAWGVRHRLAVLGFPLFHLSFFVLAAGALTVFYTRHVVVAVAAEGQTLDPAAGKLVRAAPMGAPTIAPLTVEHVDARIQDGRPVGLAVTLVGPDGEAQTSRINGPAEWGPFSALVERVGITPVFWLVDANGYTVDRVAVLTATEGGLPTSPLADGRWQLTVMPISVGKSFPEREALPRTALGVIVTRGDQEVFSGSLRPGQGVQIEDHYLRLVENRYWVYFRLVHEQGGVLIVLGFVLAVLGMVWRMVWYRRELGVLWDDRQIALIARAEYLPRQFREELELLRHLMFEAREGAVR